MRDIVVFLVVFATIPAIFMRPYIGVLVWSWLSYMNPHRLTWGPAHDFPFAQIIGVVTLLALLFSSERKRIPMNGVTVVWLLFVLWMNVTTLFALLEGPANLEWDRVMKIQFFSFISLMLMYGKDRMNYLVAVIVASIGFYSVKGGIFAILTGGSARVYGPAGSFIEDNNGLGLAVVMVLPLMVYVLSRIEHKKLRLAMLGVIGLSVLSILSTQSRGAFLAVSATIAFVWWRSKRKLISGAIILIAAPMFYFSMPQSWHDRMATISTYQEDGSAMGRINAWGFAYNLARDRPLVGGGFRAFDPDLFLTYAPVPDDFHDAHSIYFEVLGEHGFVGLALFLLLGLLTFRSAGKAVSASRDQPGLHWANELGRMLQACLVAYATGGLFLGLAYWDLYYHLVVLSVLLREHVERALQEARIPGKVAEQAGDPANADTRAATQ